MLRAGRIDKIVAVMRNESVTDERSGQKQQTWVEVAKLWAAIEPLRGNELYTAQQFNSEVTTRIVMRQSHKFTPDHTMQIHYTDRRGVLHRYEVLHDPIDPNTSGVEWQLMCKVVT